MDGAELRFSRMKDGSLAAWLSPNPDDDVVKAVAATLVKELGAIPSTTAVGLDQTYWDFRLDSYTITLHSEHYLGVALLAGEVSDAAEATLRRVASFVFERLPR